ncbi:hypothetical protein niasHT_004241 [Heterodera trifolii]|uniref:Uncharacterized protein n=1 Tax=Heterodera trifolii TaxID=157864 RepID=A0ABD2MCH4_9BILA
MGIDVDLALLLLLSLLTNLQMPCQHIARGAVRSADRQLVGKDNKRQSSGAMALQFVCVARLRCRPRPPRVAAIDLFGNGKDRVKAVGAAFPIANGKRIKTLANEKLNPTHCICRRGETQTWGTQPADAPPSAAFPPISKVIAASAAASGAVWGGGGGHLMHKPCEIPQNRAPLPPRIPPQPRRGGEGRRAL